MGRMKELSTDFIGYTVEAEAYFEGNPNPEYYNTFIEPEYLTADTVKSVLNQASIKFKSTPPNKAILYIYKTYGSDSEYSQLAKTIELTRKQCKNAWV